jgi:mannitol/fructose-specific phosphotransferase system IIA component (Ntr-type)/predicted transcriptional regulator
MKLSSLLDRKLIQCGLAARTKEEALDEVIRLMAAGTPGVTAEELRAALAEREKLGPFSMAKGSAFPHARTEKVSDFRIAVGTAPAGIDFKAPDGNPIRVLVLFVIPKKHSNLYLHTLAQFLNLLGVEENLQRVVRAPDAAELLAALDAAAPKSAPGAAEPPVPFVTPQTLLSRALEVLSVGRLEAVPVVDADGNLVGEISAAAVLQRLVYERALHTARPGDPMEVALRVHAGSTLESLGLVASNGFPTVQEGEASAEVAGKLARSTARVAYVLRGRKLAGVVTAGDVLKKLAGGK